MDMQTKNRALSALKTLANVEQVMPLIVANATAEYVDPNINSFATLYKAKVTKTFALETEVRALVKDTLSVFDSKEIDLYFQQGREVVKSITELKTGSINLPQYSLAVFSSGVKLDKVGAKTNLDVRLDASTEIKISKNRFISEFISYSLFELDTYNSIMNRVFIVDKSEEVKEVFISDFFLKTALIQEAGISLDTLLENPSYILVLELKYNRLRVVKHPMLDESTTTLINETFGTRPTFTEPSKANVGYVGFNVDLKGMAVESNDRLFSFLDPKKFAARQEKLNGDNSIARVWEDVFVITESGDKSLPYFNTGCFYASDRLLRSIGCCRLTSDINNLLIKGVTHYAPLIAKDVGMDLSIVASSSAKGGVAGIAASLGKAFNFASEVQVLPQFDVCEITLNNGDTVKGVKVRVELKITNAFTVENFWRNTEVDSVASLEEAHAADVASKTEKVIGYNKAESKALSAEMMERAVSTHTSIIDVLCDAERNSEISLKPAVTTVTPGEFENIAVTYGRKTAQEFMYSLLSNRFNKDLSAKTRSASEWLTGNVEGREVSINTIMETISELAMFHGVSVDPKPNSTFNTLFIKNVVEALGLQENGWIFIPELDVWLPTGETLVSDLYDTKNEHSITIQVTSVMKYLLSSVMYLLTAKFKGAGVNEVLLQSTGVNLKLFIQDALLNKKTAKLKTHGKYMTLLPGFWLKNKNDVCILSRDLYRPDLSHLEWIKVNIAKHPVLFLEAVAGFRCFNEIPGVELDDDLLSIFMNVVFVHPDYLLELQNDTDGDLARVTFDQYWLPPYTGKVLESCAAEFHKNYIAGENDLGININKLPSVKSFTHDELYKAIAQASEAKENVAMFTDNLHKLQAGIRTSPVTKQVMAEHGKEKGGQLLKDAVIMTATLIQTDAMNAIKHSGGVTAGSSLTSAMLRSEEDVEVAKQAVVSYLGQHSFTYTGSDAVMFANIVVDLFANIHIIEMNKHKPHLTNQIERLVFKNQPNHVVLQTTEDGKEVPVARRLDLFGMYSESWNVTGDNSMFVELLSKFFGRK